MPYRKKTLRALPEATRKLAKQADYIESVARGIKHNIEVFASLEMDSRALREHRGCPFPWLVILPTCLDVEHHA